MLKGGAGGGTGEAVQSSLNIARSVPLRQLSALPHWTQTSERYPHLPAWFCFTHHLRSPVLSQHLRSSVPSFHLCHLSPLLSSAFPCSFGQGLFSPRDWLESSSCFGVAGPLVSFGNWVSISGWRLRAPFLYLGSILVPKALGMPGGQQAEWGV